MTEKRTLTCFRAEKDKQKIMISSLIAYAIQSGTLTYVKVIDILSNKRLNHE